MPFYLIRHLPTPWNINGLLQGSRDISIKEPDTGVLKKIMHNKGMIANIKFDCVLASNLKRTHQTATHYGYTDLLEEPLLNELDFGPYEGKEKKLLLQDLGDAWVTDPRGLVLGESMHDFEIRLKSFISKYQSQSVLAFTHGAVIRGIKALNQEGTIQHMNRFTIDNNSMTIIE